MSRYFAPAGAPIRFTDLARWPMIAASSPDASDALGRHLRERFGVHECFLTSTGRAGMTLLLQAMRRLAPDRDQVVLPSYTCYSVAASVVKAGLRPRVLDIAPETLDYDLHALETADHGRTLAIVATNLYGLPGDLPRLHQLSRRLGVFLVDDAAQAMGASVGGRASGTWGDAGLFSFDRGKNVSAIEGGVVLTQSSELAGAVRQELAALPPGRRVAPLVHVMKALAYAAMLRPLLYGIPARIPQLGLGRTVFTTEFELAPAAPVVASLALTMMRRLDEFTNARVANARALLDGLDGLRVTTIHPGADARAVYLRLPVLWASRAVRDAAVLALNRAGIGATSSYPASLADVAELKPHLVDPVPPARGGREVAARIMTLPTHPYVGPRARARAIEVLRALGLPEGTGASARPLTAAGR